MHEALTTGKRYDGGAATAAQIAHASAPEDDVLPRAIALATELSDKDPGVVSTHKHLLYDDVLRLGGG